MHESEDAAAAAYDQGALCLLVRVWLHMHRWYRLYQLHLECRCPPGPRPSVPASCAPA